MELFQLIETFQEALPARSVTEMIAEAIDVVVHQRLEAQTAAARLPLFGPAT